MKLFVGCVGVLIAVLGCEGSNPRSCIDGTCTDPSLPFCDSDGRFSGTPGVCIAVTCTPGQFDSCRDGKALVCNPQGTSYEMNACPGQCEESAGGCVDCNANDQCPAPRDVCDLATNECVECTASSQCSSPRPVCKVSERECVECVTSSDCMPPKAVCNTAVNQCAVGCTISSQCPASEPFCDTGMMLCRRCERDSECASDLCELSTGQCVAESEITYASPNGSGGACGAKATPCTLTAAWSRMDSTHHIIKLAPGTYTTSAALTVPNTAVTVYGYGATVTTTTGITLQLAGAATLRLDGINFINADVNAGFLGGIGSGLTTCSVRLNDVRVDSANTWGLSGCMLVADRSTIVWPTNFDQPGIALNGPADLTVSHSIVRNAGVRIYNNARVHISNSLFRDTRHSALGISNANGGTNDISFTTFVNSPLDQTLPAPDAVTVANCILMGAPLGSNVISGNAFSVRYSLLNPQIAAPTGSVNTLLNVDPRFVNPAAGDFHLQTGSPAIDAADPLSLLLDDLEGMKRPVGTGRDLGAFERQ